MKHVAIVVDWYGPYAVKNALMAAKYDYDKGLYLFIGKRRYQHGQPATQYIGLSKKLSTRLSQQCKSKLQEITRDAKLWLGEVGTAEIAGPKVKRTPVTLDVVEWLHAYFLHLPLNERKTIKPPDRSATVLNRWWHIDYQTRWVKRPHPSWPDIIEYLGPNNSAKLVWFGGKLKRVKPPFNQG